MLILKENTWTFGQGIQSITSMKVSGLFRTEINDNRDKDRSWHDGGNMDPKDLFTFKSIYDRC